MQTLPLVYLIEDQRWIPREAAFMRGPDDQERLVTQWNHHCIRCHSTGWNPGLDDRSGMLNTEVAELGISCEACHGPGSYHVELANRKSLFWDRKHGFGLAKLKTESNLPQIESCAPCHGPGKEHIAYHRNPFNRYARHLGSEPTHASDLVNPAKLDHQLSSHVCGQCHGVFMPNNDSAMDVAHKGVQFRPGENLHDKRYYIQYPKDPDDQERWADLQANPQFFAERWWEDGTVLAGGREFTAMSASGCYTRGKMSCLSCHSMHQAPPEDQLTPQSNANASCTQCHQEAEYNERIESHTFHSRESSGSECMNCHMPHTTYALFNAIRSHQIASPQVASSLEHGVPNACNLCHLDQ
ncbi:MAG: cytochrome c3 family protein, partial [Limisphaerales bacterium]